MRRMLVVALVAVGLAGCGSSSPGSTTSSGQSQSRTASAASNAATLHKAQACVSVIGSFSHLGESLKVSSSSVATIASTKEHLHELQGTVSSADQYTIGRTTEVLTRLEAAIEKASGGSYGEANGALTGIGDEVKELLPKIIAMCGRSPVVSGEAESNPSTTASEVSASSGSVSQAASALAPLCVTAAESGTSNPPGVAEKVKALVGAYEHDQAKAADRHYMEVAEENLKSGCGSKYLPEVEAALAK
jgi:hypothetical protein